MLRMLEGLFTYESGEVFVDGQSLNDELEAMLCLHVPEDFKTLGLETRYRLTIEPVNE